MRITVGYCFSNRVLFGITTGPLVWRRIAVLVSRLTKALYPPAMGRLRTYVYEIVLGIRGRQQSGRRCEAEVLWFWEALQLKISRQKRSWADTAEWIGVSVKVQATKKQVTMSMPEGK